MIANTDFVSIFPDPDSPDFEANFVPLPEGVTDEALRHAREMTAKLFHPNRGMMGKGEGLSRKNLTELLPDSDRPSLEGIGGNGPWLTVAGHEFETMSEENLKVCAVVKEAI